MNAREIERVFLLDRMPEEIPEAILEQAETWLVEQGYFAPPPESTSASVEPGPGRPGPGPAAGPGPAGKIYFQNHKILILRRYSSQVLIIFLSGQKKLFLLISFQFQFSLLIL